MKKITLRCINIILFLAISSCGSEKDRDLAEIIDEASNYSSASKTQFINEVLLKKCSAYKQRNIQRYNSCIQETKSSLDVIDWALFDSLEENQKNNILAPCNSYMIRKPDRFSDCMNKQLIGFKALPKELQDDLNIARAPKKQLQSTNKDSWIDFLNGENSNDNILSGEEIFQMFEKSVFMVLAANQNNNSSTQGSAVAVSGNMLFTNCHVVLDDRNQPYDVIALANDALDEDAWFEAEVFKMEPTSDRCILKSIQKDDLQSIPIGRKTLDLKVGEQVLALGYPKAQDLNFDSQYRAPLTLSMGIISAIRDQSNITQIQTDAFIINGSSGGALLDMKGNLVGITTSGFRGTQLNFAIASEEYKEL
tara:strand:+ start:798 stop:1892 length:1095 start_codon:yes stop_codon:yes gene_type:complete